MKRAMRVLAFVLALAFLGLSFVNASWLAAEPQGYLKLVAQGGTMQQSDRRGLRPGDCAAKRIEPPLHEFLEDTAPAIAEARRLGAQMVAVDVVPTADGKLVLFPDAALDCRTNGHGPVSAATLEQLKTLDAGYGYTADGGRSFLLRGKGVGLIPSLEEGLAAAGDAALLYNLTGSDPAEADQLIAALKAAGRDVAARGDGFSAPEPLLTRLRAAFPTAWSFSRESADACTSAYLKAGWFGITPQACHNGTIVIPLNYRWAFAGWPNRLIARMAAVGARVTVTGPSAGGEAPSGLDLPEQLGDVPADFNGYVRVGDIWAVGPALHPAYDKRNPREEAELAKALDRRRAARD